MLLLSKIFSCLHVLQESLSDLSLFEQASGKSKENVLNPQWTIVMAGPLSSTPEQIEESVMQLVEVRTLTALLEIYLEDACNIFSV